jgi:hypothetical protein
MIGPTPDVADVTERVAAYARANRAAARPFGRRAPLAPARRRRSPRTDRVYRSRTPHRRNRWFVSFGDHAARAAACHTPANGTGSLKVLGTDGNAGWLHPPLPPITMRLAAASVALPSLTPAQDAHLASTDPAPPILQTGRRTVVAERLRDGERITLDGRLGEEFWLRAVPATDLVVQEPTPGGTPTERTEVRIALDRDNLYMGVTNYDSEPDRLMGNAKERDDFLPEDDRFM